MLPSAPELGEKKGAPPTPPRIGRWSLLLPHLPADACWPGGLLGSERDRLAPSPGALLTGETWTDLGGGGPWQRGASAGLGVRVDTAHPPPQGRCGPSKIEAKPDPVTRSTRRHHAEHRQPWRRPGRPARLQGASCLSGHRCGLPHCPPRRPGSPRHLGRFWGRGRRQKTGQSSALVGAQGRGLPGAVPGSASLGTLEMGWGAGRPLLVSALTPFSFPAHVSGCQHVAAWQLGCPGPTFGPSPLRPAPGLPRAQLRSLPAPAMLVAQRRPLATAAANALSSAWLAVCGAQ